MLPFGSGGGLQDVKGKPGTTGTCSSPGDGFSFWVALREHKAPAVPKLPKKHLGGNKKLLIHPTVRMGNKQLPGCSSGRAHPCCAAATGTGGIGCSRAAWVRSVLPHRVLSFASPQ